MRRLSWVIAAGLLFPAALTGAPGSAQSHALLLDSSPRPDEFVGASPPRIFLRFNSRIEGALSRITLTGPGGRAIPLPVAAPDSAPNHLAVPVPLLEPGEYLVRWKVLSTDGHLTEGAFRFTLAPGP